MNPIPPSIRVLLRVAALGGFIFILMGSLAVGSNQQIALDKLVHGVGYGMLGMLMVMGLPVIWYLPAFLSICVAGMALEWAQVKLIHTRNFEVADISANLAGLVIGCLLGWLFCRIWGRIRRELIAAGELRRRHFFKTDEIIFHEGDPSDYLYVIRSGEVKLSRIDQEDFANAGVGEVIGEMGVINQQPRMATAKALCDTELYQLSEDALKAPKQDGTEHPALLVARVLAKRLLETTKAKSRSTARIDIDL